MPLEHKRFLESLPFWFKAEGFLFVHAGIRPGFPLEAQDEEDLMWIPGQHPEEFQKYFAGCRIPRDQEGARKPFVSEEIIQTVGKYTAVPDHFPLAFNARPSYRFY